MSDDALSTWLSFNDLKHAGIVKNWQCLQDWINDPKVAFPRGKLFGPNTRRWNKEREIDPWPESRPVDREEFKTKELHLRARLAAAIAAIKMRS